MPPWSVLSISLSSLTRGEDKVSSAKGGWQDPPEVGSVMVDSSLWEQRLGFNGLHGGSRPGPDLRLHLTLTGSHLMLCVPSLKIPLATPWKHLHRPSCRGHEKQPFFISWPSYPRFEGIVRDWETCCRGAESTSFGVVGHTTSVNTIPLCRIHVKAPQAIWE